MLWVFSVKIIIVNLVTSKSLLVVIKENYEIIFLHMSGT